MNPQPRTTGRAWPHEFITAFLALACAFVWGLVALLLAG